MDVLKTGVTKSLTPGTVMKSSRGYKAANKRGQTAVFPNYSQANDFAMSESVLDELSRGKLAAYVADAAVDTKTKSRQAGWEMGIARSFVQTPSETKAIHRVQGIKAASKRLAEDGIAPNPSASDSPQGYDDAMSYQNDGPTDQSMDGDRLLETLEAIAIGAAECYEVLADAEDKPQWAQEQLNQAYYTIKQLHDQVGPSDDSNEEKGDEGNQGGADVASQQKPSAFKEDLDDSGDYDVPLKKPKRSTTNLYHATDKPIRAWSSFSDVPDETHNDPEAPWRKKAPLGEDLGSLAHFAGAHMNSAMFDAGVGYAVAKAGDHVGHAHHTAKKLFNKVKNGLNKRRASNDNVSEGMAIMSGSDAIRPAGKCSNDNADNDQAARLLARGKTLGRGASPADTEHFRAKQKAEAGKKMYQDIMRKNWAQWAESTETKKPKPKTAKRKRASFRQLSSQLSDKYGGQSPGATTGMAKGNGK